MTRKQAAAKAIELLSGNEENREICEALGKVVNGRLTEIWNKELLLEAIQDFINENGYYPSSREMDEDPMLPAHASAYIVMGMGYNKVRETYFPDVAKKEDCNLISKEEWIEKFKTIYQEMGMPTQKQFDMGRQKGEVGAATTWIRRAGCDSWNDLLQKCGFQESIRKDDNRHCALTVSVSESNLPVEAYKKMEDELNRVLV